MTPEVLTQNSDIWQRTFPDESQRQLVQAFVDEISSHYFFDGMGMSFEKIVGIAVAEDRRRNDGSQLVIVVDYEAYDERDLKNLKLIVRFGVGWMDKLDYKVKTRGEFKSLQKRSRLAGREVITLWERQEVSTEELVQTLKAAVSEAHERDENVHGVILFGSRSRKDCTRKRISLNSDVDLLGVTGRFDKRTVRVLGQCLFQRITGDLHIKPNVARTFGLDSLICGSRSQSGSYALETCQILDRESIFVLVNPEDVKKIKEFSGCTEKEWTWNRKPVSFGPRYDSPY